MTPSDELELRRLIQASIGSDQVYMDAQKAKCKQKITFASVGAAQMRVDYINTLKNFKRFRVYQCRWCQFYHTTSQPDFEVRMRKQMKIEERKAA